MCLATYLPPGVAPVREHLENGALLNPHGHGFAVGWHVSRSMDAERTIKDFMRVREEHPYLPAMFHSRSATGDSPVTKQNVHPFTIVRGSNIMTVCHNGYLFPHEGEKSDSLVFATEILPRYDLDDERDRALLEMRMSPNKAIVFRPGKEVRILNRQLGILLGDGKWYSNPDYTGVPRLVPGICPQCKSETDQKPVCPSCEEQAQARRALLLRGKEEI